MKTENEHVILAGRNPSKRYFNSITVYDRAVKFHRIPTYDCRLVGKKPSKRGTIKTFSRHSRLRLREAIANNHILNSCCYGVTLTVPWRDYYNDKFTRDFLNLDDQTFVKIYQECFHRFEVTFRRRFPNSGAIFRHELQRRKMPHCHLIIYLSNIDLDFSVEALKSAILPLWWNSLNDQFFGGDKIGFFKYGCHCELLNDHLAMFRYLADHQSKSKQAQMGYLGKHWGIIQKKNFQIVDHERVDFVDEKSRIFFSRHISRLCRFSISFERWKKSRNRSGRFDHFERFGSKKVRANSVGGFRFVSRRSLFPLLRYMKKNKMVK